jgi:hypothetical protein
MNSKPTTELEWLYYNLWLKTGQAPPHFIFTVAETVFFRETNAGNGDVKIPESWYFTSKDGFILKKNRLNVSTSEVQKQFTKRMEIYDQVAAVTYAMRKGQDDDTVEIDVCHL